ncbi:MAG: EamA family transporter [Candidatus Omnitrophica bacterium]|nr:EamA family transporter [Candidatus Omnitrophota bacterium]
MSDATMNYTLLGGLAALFSAFAWAFDPILFKKLGERVSPLGLNLGRGAIGVLLLSVMLLPFGFSPIPARSLFFLVVSGIFGIALGDTFFFMGLMRIGPRLSILMETLCPVVSVLLAVIVLRERPGIAVWSGIVLTISGVAWVLWERAPREKLKEHWAPGVKFGILSVLSTSVGIIFLKIGVKDVPPVQATAVKLFAGTLGLALWGLVGLKIKTWVRPLRHAGTFSVLTLAVVIGICGGLLFSVIAIKYTIASIAVPLNSTTPLFVLPLVAVLYKEKISLRAFLGALVAVIGIILIFLHS